MKNITISVLLTLSAVTCVQADAAPEGFFPTAYLLGQQLPPLVYDLSAVNIND